MKYQEIVNKIKESPILLIGIGNELQIKAELTGEAVDSVEYARKLCQLAGQGEEGTVLKQYLDAYETIRRLTDGKDYFIVTTNIDGMVERMGFDTERIVSPCGSVYRMQCEEQEHGVWNIEEALKGEKALLCPVCGKPGKLNIVRNKPYNESGYLKQWEAYTRWLQKTINRKIFLLELGEDFETPTVIRWPFEKIAFINQKSAFARVNSRLPQISEDVKERAFSVKESSIDFLYQISELLNG
ncbi:MAG: hypothetical protein J6B06_04660 [Lachnospiraceae bacterium]|nr:hypothetical protein [Lachnospiraceae bacterium]